ncbi:glycosyltransferase family 4 protein [Altererythrobacter sp. GH1-8]|uniref:glycosyltransferase family 4 protein n=1 Tax=Altererythrobacter sp. GH1-8 TaxID=3349333 RepID=UPI00374D294E
MVVRQLVEYLPKLAPEWCFLFLRSREMPDPLSSDPNVRELEVSAGSNSPAGMWLLPHLVDLHGVDLFHAPSNILPAGLKMATVTTIHDLMWLTRPDLCNPRLWGHAERLFYQHGMRRALRSSDAIVSVSEATRSDIAHYSPAAEAKTTAILSGVSDHFRPVDPNAPDLLAIGLADAPYILTVGQNAPYKNHEAALKSFARAFAQTDMRLVLVQRRGQRMRALDEFARSLGIAGQIQAIEPVNDEALVKLYSGALALLHPSLCEGFGMPVAEAMACGCPVITSNLSAMPEVAGDAALLIDPTDQDAIAAALQRVASEPGLRAEMKARGLNRAAQLSWKRCAERHIELYREVLDRR